MSVGTISGLTLNNFLIVGIHLGPPNVGTVSVGSISDAQGNPWGVDASNGATATGSGQGIALCSTLLQTLSSGTITSVTIHLSGQTTLAYKFEEFSGLDPNNWDDTGSAGRTNASTSVATNSIAPLASGELVVAVFGPPRDEALFTPGGSYPQAGAPRGATPEICFEYLIAAPAGTQNATGTLAAAGIGNYGHAISAYFPPSVFPPETVELQAVNRAATY